MLHKRPVLVLAAAAVLLLSPSLIVGTVLSHSSPQNLTWATQFSEQFRAGILYPRWMPQSFDGLGSPAFYFYPPLPFWLDALVSVITANLMSVSYRLVVTSLLILFASGLAMHAWLKAQKASATVALWGAVAWMAAPYHLLDYYMRGAWAEFTAFVFLPLVLLTLRSPVLLALAYAGLLLSHLPTALLVSVTVLPACALRGGPTPVELAKMLAGGLLGIALAAIYLVPALTLQGWISAHQLWMPFYDVKRWFVLTPERWPEPYIMKAIASFTVAYAVAAASVMLAFRQYFWSGLALACLALIAGAVPWFWQLPELSKVQFPWRLMLVVEFALITALCCVPLASLGRPRIYLFVAALIALVPGLALVGDDTVERVQFMQKRLTLRQQDVKEYEPNGYPQAATLGYADLGLEPVKDVPLIVCSPPARRCEATERPSGELRIEIEADTATSVVLRRFFFPAWRLDPPLPLAASEKLRLVSFTAPAGTHSYFLDRQTLPAEWWGGLISAAALIALLGWSLPARFGAAKSPT
ncbi:MAG TPA: 6-pyruvoyl-tetrahydropterin synthase-related protein [Reyranella sp.]|nr:6-pyruvoyl-tetrahydropterin synthase-related protein [Reyranella sp.]